MRWAILSVVLGLAGSGCGGESSEADDEPCVPSDDGAPCCDAVPDPVCTGDEVLTDEIDVAGDHVRACRIDGMFHGDFAVDSENGAARWGAQVPGAQGVGPKGVVYFCRSGATYAHAMIESPSQVDGDEHYQGVCWEDGGDRVPCYGMCDQVLCDEAP